MKNTISVLLIVLFCLNIGNAQSLSQQVVSSSGAAIIGASNSLSFTAGEAIIGPITSGSSLGQGFWLGAIEAVVLSSEDFTIEQQITVYPNPVVNYLKLTFNEMAGQDFDIHVYDSNGKQVLHKELRNSSENETLNFSTLSKGIYVLNIVQRETNKSKTYKIINQ